MLEVLSYIENNKEWIFSGVGIFLLGIIIHIIKKYFKSKSKHTCSMTQINKSSSYGTQIGTQNNYYRRSDEHDR